MNETGKIKSYDSISEMRLENGGEIPFYKLIFNGKFEKKSWKFESLRESS